MAAQAASSVLPAAAAAAQAPDAGAASAGSGTPSRLAMRRESPTGPAEPLGTAPALLGESGAANSPPAAANAAADQFVRNEHARARAADASWQHWWQRLIDRGTVVEGILILDADSLHPWVFRGIEGYAAPAPMPEWAQPHLRATSSNSSWRRSRLQRSWHAWRI